MSVTTEGLQAQEGETAAGYHQSWFPVALASDVPAGRPLGRDFLGTRVVIYRDATGRPVVQGAYCPHLGADLSVGEVVEGQDVADKISNAPRDGSDRPRTPITLNKVRIERVAG